MNIKQTAVESADICLKYYAMHPEDAIFRTDIRMIQPTLFNNEFILTLDKKIRSKARQISLQHAGCPCLCLLSSSSPEIYRLYTSSRTRTDSEGHGKTMNTAEPFPRGKAFLTEHMGVSDQ